MANRPLELAELEDGKNENKVHKPANQDEFVLEQVLGLTSTCTHALACNPVTGVVAFPAACMLVILDPKTGEQKFIESPSLHYISCVCYSDDGLLVALGESGTKPHIAIWSTKEHKEFNRFATDKSVGIKSIVLHPKSQFLATTGVHEMTIEVWDYVRGQRLALSKWQTVPLSLTIPKLGTCVIVCGHRKITLFKIEDVDSSNYETNVFGDRKAVLLGRQSEYTFVDITSGKGKHDKMVYTVTACGYLCQIMLGDILIDKATKVDVHSYCVRYGMDHVFVGCCEGVVKICHPVSLNVAAAVSLSNLLGPEAMPKVGSKLYMDTTAIAVNDRDSIVTCIYADGNMHSWQINSLKDTIECSAILPLSKRQRGSTDGGSAINDQAYKASLLRSFIGCSETIKSTMMFDPLSLAFKPRHQGHQSAIHQMNGSIVRCSPDGKDVVCGNKDGEIKVYEAANGTLRRVIEAHSSHVTCVEFMYDDSFKLLATGGRDRIIFVLDAKNDFSLVQVLCDHSAAITALSLVHNGGALTLVSAAADNVILIRKAIVGTSLKFTITGEIAETKSNKSFFITNDYIVTGSTNGNIKLFRADPVFSAKAAKTIKCPNKTQPNSTGYRAIDIDPSGSFLATTQNPGHITVYHLQTGQPVASLSSQSDVHSVKFTVDLKYIISSTSHGCTLVWRIPERMTDFMKSKQEKLYQIEMAREISYETYVSCVRLCKELGSDESTASADKKEHVSNSNHNSDRDVTPSIESLSLLKMCRTGSIDPDRQSACNTESFISSSACTESFTDTINSGPTTDSSVQMCPSPVRFYCGNDDRIFGKLVEQRKCIKLGPFKDKYVDNITETLDGRDPESEVDDTIKEIKKEDEKKEIVEQPTMSQIKPTNKSSSCGNISKQEVTKAPEKSIFRKSSDGTNVNEECLAVSTGDKTIQGRLEMNSPPSLISPGSFQTANSPFSTHSKDRSFTPDDNAFFSPLCNTSDVEDFDRFNKGSPSKAFWQSSTVYGTKITSPPKTEGKGQESLCEKSYLATSSNLNTPKASNPPAVHFVSKACDNENQWEDSFYRGLQKAYEAEMKQGMPRSPKVIQDQLDDCRRPLPGTDDNHGAELNTKPKSDVTKTSGFQFTGSNGTVCDSSYNTDVHKESNKFPSESIPYGGPCEATDEKDQPEKKMCEGIIKLPGLECLDEGEVYNYHSITRDEHGKLRRVDVSEGNSLQSPVADGFAEHFSTSVYKPAVKKRENLPETETSNIDKSPSIWHIQCSRCVHREDSKSACFLTSTLGNCMRTEAMSMAPSTRLSHFNNDNVSNSRLLEVDETQLQEYYSDLRRCLHLSNSQETFNKLKCDVDDDELMDYLSDALKNRPEEFAEMFNLSLSEIEKMQKMNIFECTDKSCPWPPKELCLSNSAACGVKTEENIGDASATLKTINKVENTTDTCGDVAFQIQYPMSSERGDNTNTDTVAMAGHIDPRSKKSSPQTIFESPPRSKTEGAVKKKLPYSTDRRVAGHDQVTLCVEGEGQEMNHNEDGLSSDHIKNVDGTCSMKESSQQDPSKTAHTFTSTHGEILATQTSLNSCRHAIHLLSGVNDFKPENEKRKGTGSVSKNMSPGVERKIAQLVSSSNSTPYYNNLRHQAESPKKFQSLKSQRDITLKRSPLRPQIAEKQNIEQQTNKEDETVATEKKVMKEKVQPETNKVTAVSPVLEASAQPALPTRPDDSVEGPVSVESGQTRDRKYSQSFAEMFRDQDDYLKKLKEVREKFEMSIQALSNERKSRWAEEEKTLHNK